MKKRSAKVMLTLTSSALLVGGSLQAADAKSTVASTNPAPAHATAAKLATLNKAELRKMLTTIEKANVPEPKMGAMCYSIASPPPTMSYVCPLCGEKTLYTDDVVWKWSFKLDSCRRLFKELPNRETMTLDESSFCKKCTPGTNAPALKLQIRFDNGTTNTVSNLTDDDLRLLSGFLSGKLDYPTFNAGTGALKDKLPRLRELLGIKED